MPAFVARRSLLAAVALLGLVASPVLGQDDVPVIAVAANLEFAVTEIADQFRAETGLQVRLSFGSTGNIARQIRQGAPYEVFLAADDATPLDLHAAGFTHDPGAVFAVGRIVLAAPHGSPIDVQAGLAGISGLLAAGQIVRFAIANPDHAPFGIAAREALVAKGLWEDVQPFLVQGENVSQAAAFALSGNADGGIIAYSLALAPQVARQGTFALIPQDWHSALHQRMVLLHSAGPTAKAFYAYMADPAARVILARYGFAMPEE